MGVPQNQYSQQTYQGSGGEPLNGCLVALMIVLAIFLPILGPIIAIIIGAVNTKKSGGVAILIAGIIMLLLNVVLFFTMFSVVKAFIDGTGPMAEEFQSGYYEVTGTQIQMGLESYSMDNGHYPDELDDLVPAYIASMPMNLSNILALEEVEDVRFGDSDYAGNVTYVKYEEGGEVTGYYLLMYGKEIEGEDVDGDGEGDHVVLILDSGRGLPDLEELLTGSSSGGSSSGGSSSSGGKPDPDSRPSKGK